MAGDAYYDNVSLLLHFDGSDASTTFTDNSPSPKTLTAYGNAQLDTAQSKFGTASLLLDGSGDYLFLGSGSPSGTGDWCLEMWFRVASIPASGVRMFATFYNSINFELRSDGAIGLFLYGPSLYMYGGSCVANTWYHIAATRSGNNFNLYLDGTRVGTFSSTQSLPTARDLRIGAQYLEATRDFNGWIDDFRLTVGQARYTGTTYTVPTEAFSNYREINAYSSAAGPLKSAASLAAAEVLARSSSDGPLRAAQILAAGEVLARHSSSGPLGDMLSRAAVQFASSSAPSPLKAALVVSRAHPSALVSVPGPLRSALLKAWNDSLITIPPTATTIYTCDLIDGATITRLPISSWQATIQTGAASYVQVVVPAASEYAEAIADALESETAELVVYRGARLSDGTIIESEMARAPLETATTDRGPTRYTATLSGYASAWTPDPNPPAVATRALQKIRSISTTNGLPRVRCAIDWLLQPGLTATAEEIEFTVGYINFYATSSGDTYCDVGQSSTA